MPKMVQKQGYRVIQPTGWENFSNMLGGFVQALLQQKKQENQALFDAEKTQAQQAQFRLSLQELAVRDPVAYNQIIKDPSVISYLDPKRADNIRQNAMSPLDKIKQRFDKNKPAPTTPEQRVKLDPVTGEPLETFLAERSARLRGTKAQAQLAEMQIPQEELKVFMAQARLKNWDSDDILKRFEARFGTVPNKEQLATLYGLNTKDVLVEQTPGTLEWKRSQSRGLVAELTKNYPIKTPEDRQRIQSYAEWMMGMSDSPNAPELPKGYAQLKSEMDERSMKLREQELGISRAHLALSQKQLRQSVMSDFIKAGASIIDSNRAANAILEGKDLPADIKVTGPDLERRIQEAQLKQLNARMEDLELKDPRIGQLKSVIASAPTPEAAMPYWNALQKHMRDKYGISVPAPEDNSWAGQAWKAYFNYGIKTAIPGVDSTLKRGRDAMLGVGRGGSSEEEAPPQASGKTPPSAEALTLFSSTADKAKAAFSSPTLTPEQKAELQRLMLAAADGYDSGDAMQLLAVEHDLRAYLTSIGVK